MPPTATPDPRRALRAVLDCTADVASAGRSLRALDLHRALAAAREAQVSLARVIAAIEGEMGTQIVFPGD